MYMGIQYYLHILYIQFYKQGLHDTHGKTIKFAFNSIILEVKNIFLEDFKFRFLGISDKLFLKYCI